MTPRSQWWRVPLTTGSCCHRSTRYFIGSLFYCSTSCKRSLEESSRHFQKTPQKRKKWWEERRRCRRRANRKMEIFQTDALRFGHGGDRKVANFFPSGHQVRSIFLIARFLSSLLLVQAETCRFERNGVRVPQIYLRKCTRKQCLKGKVKYTLHFSFVTFNLVLYGRTVGCLQWLNCILCIIKK